MALKSGELRLGNIILDDEGKLVVVRALSNTIPRLIPCEDPEGGCTAEGEDPIIYSPIGEPDNLQVPDDIVEPLSKLNGVPITPERLMQAGFEHRWGESYGNGFVVLEKHGGGWLLMTEERSAYPKVYMFVHEVQNIFFALTGEELIIKP